MSKNRNSDLDDRRKNMPTIKHYESSEDDDDDVVTEIFTRKPSDRRSKPSIEALRDQHKDFFARYTIPKLPKGDNHSEASSTEERYIAPEKRSSPPQKPKLLKKKGPPSQKKLKVSHEDANDISSLSSEAEEAALATPPTQEKVLERKAPPPEENLPNESEMNTTIITGFTLFFEEAKKLAVFKSPNAPFEELRKTVYDWWMRLDKVEKEKYDDKAKVLQRKSRPGPLSMKKKWNERLLESVKTESQVEEQTVASQVRDIPPARKIVRCANEACNNIAIDDPRWNGEFCSTACVVQHCKDVLQNFVIARKEKRLEDEQAKMNISDDIFESSDIIVLP